MQTITGREATVLALLAQSRGLTAADRRRILSVLDGLALKIAQAMCNKTMRVSKDVRAAADSLMRWANGITPRNH